jgi:hypothetical protein
MYSLVTTTIEGSPSVHIAEVDAALDAIQRRREEAIACSDGRTMYRRLAELADAEAGWWEQVSERARFRLHWRAALTAREHARYLAGRYRRLAEASLPLASPLHRPNPIIPAMLSVAPRPEAIR